MVNQTPTDGIRVAEQPKAEPARIQQAPNTDEYLAVQKPADPNPTSPEAEPTTDQLPEAVRPDTDFELPPTNDPEIAAVRSNTRKSLWGSIKEFLKNLFSKKPAG